MSSPERVTGKEYPCKAEIRITQNIKTYEPYAHEVTAELNCKPCNIYSKATVIDTEPEDAAREAIDVLKGVLELRCPLKTARTQQKKEK